jgi:serine/threonine-protein kinase
MGTPQFMSPEQCTGRGVDHRTDIYALGVILFRIYCGKLPFEGESVAEVMTAQLTQPPPKPSEFAQLSPPLENLILSCLDKNPANRPVSAAELGMRLREVAQVGGAITALHAPMQRTGEAKAKTRKGFAVEGEASGKSKAASSSRRNLLLGLIAAAVAGGALAAWLATRGGTGAAQPAASASPSASPAPALAVPPAPVEPVVAAPAVAAPAIIAPPPVASEPAAPTKRLGARSVRPGENTAKSNPVPPETNKSKPSRAARQGLIQENPF